MRLIHTSDWHLGHLLADWPRDEEHGIFLAWLRETVAQERADALLIAGDVFDTPNPSAAAQAMLYGFFADLHAAMPELQTVVIAGNHDSGARLDAPGPLLAALGVRVIGAPPRRREGGFDAESVVVPLYQDGVVRAYAVAVPFLRPSDLPPVEEADGDALIEGVRRVYAASVAAVRRAPGQAIVALGHAYLTGSTLSELSERRILGGNQHALPVDVFPPEVAYTALGHLHKAQRVGEDRVRYCGSPLPLSMAERHYRHQVLRIDLDGEGIAKNADGTLAIAALETPRPVAFVRVGDAAPVTVDEAVAELAKLPPRERLPIGLWPFVDVRVRLDGPDPTLRHRIELALKDRAARLVSLIQERPDRVDAPPADLGTLSPEDVFRRMYARKYGSDASPSPELVAAFRGLVASVEAEVS